MKIATLDLTPELFVEICKASRNNDGRPRRFIVKDYPLPDDVEIVRVRQSDRFPDTLQLVLKSECFPDVPEDHPTKHPAVVYETIYE